MNTHSLSFHFSTGNWVKKKLQWVVSLTLSLSFHSVILAYVTSSFPWITVNFLILYGKIEKTVFYEDITDIGRVPFFYEKRTVHYFQNPILWIICGMTWLLKYLLLLAWKAMPLAVAFIIWRWQQVASSALSPAPSVCVPYLPTHTHMIYPTLTLTFKPWLALYFESYNQPFPTSLSSFFLGKPDLSDSGMIFPSLELHLLFPTNLTFLPCSTWSTSLLGMSLSSCILLTLDYNYIWSCPCL